VLLINHDIGMCGARPIPTNGHGTFPGEATRFLWHMHHRVALEAPKLGELVMLRSGIVHGLPPESCVDEATLEGLIVAAGYRLAYVPEAVVHNHGPETVRDFVRQRRRIAAGHYWLRDVCGYAVSTMDVSRIARLTLSELSLRTPTRTAYALGTIGVEVISRALASSTSAPARTTTSGRSRRRPSRSSPTSCAPNTISIRASRLARSPNT